MQQSLLAALAESCYVMLMLSSLGDQLQYPKLCAQLRFALSHESKVLGRARSGVTTLMPLAHSLNVARDCSHAMESDSQSGTYYRFIAKTARTCKNCRARAFHQDNRGYSHSRS